jgi:alginate O-acetyltransferase complex protein AlgI
MLFCSQQFLIFFCLVFAFYWALPRQALRVYLLVAASFFFYASWNKGLAALIGLSTLLDYGVARGMDATQSRPWRRAFLVVSLVVNLGLLGYFKYANFFLHSVEEGLHRLGATASLPVLGVLLPVGISFYTFEAINYTVDVYRRRIAAERNLLHFMLFITFFPHLIAGPIVRARDFLPQIRRRKRWDWLRLQVGLQYFLIGLVKKMVIADRVAQYSDPIFARPDQFSTAALWLAVLAYALQIYCDFSGYTDMALGAAHMLGYKLAKNFEMPYLAVNISEFWRRWHISLSTWLRDYVFIPLGGSRGSNWQVCRNLLLTMTLGGLWHGAAWTFVFWGLLHGAFLVVHRGFRAACARCPLVEGWLQSAVGTVLRIAVTFLSVCAGWVFFRSTTFASATTILKHMLLFHAGRPVPLPTPILLFLAAVIGLGYLTVASGLWKRWAFRLPGPVWGASYAGVLTLALTLAPQTTKVFIYFQF